MRNCWHTTISPATALSFGDDIRSTNTRGLTWRDVRVPVDIRRTGVSAPPWFPFDLQGFNIAPTSGLVDALCHAVDYKQQRPHVVPLLADVNIHYRIVKVVYCLTNSDQNVIGSLQGMPMLFGIWHAYVHVLRRT